MNFEQSAAVPLAAITALQGLRDTGKIQQGKKVLINGASGGVGTFAVQMARSFGAEVTAVCSTAKIETVRALGAHHVIDYTKENFTNKSEQYDLIIGANGYHSLSDYKRVLSPRGIYVMIGGTNKQIFQAMLLGPWMSMTGTKRMTILTAKPNQKDLGFLKELLESGQVVPIIDRKYCLSEVPQAMRYLEEGHAKGKIVITMNE
jgi:NADPH:quinone reductase-like Zn-dependent oxidoreductase